MFSPIIAFTNIVVTKIKITMVIHLVRCVPLKTTKWMGVRYTGLPSISLTTKEFGASIEGKEHYV